MYFDVMLGKINFNELISSWERAVQELDLFSDIIPSVKYSSDEWKKHINSQTWIPELSQTFLRMKALDKRLL